MRRYRRGHPGVGLDDYLIASLSHWRRIAAAACADPWGPVAADLTQAVGLAEDVGVAATLRRVLDRARVDDEAAARAEVRRRLRQLISDSGLTVGQFAQRLGTSASRLSTFVTGRVVPSAAVLIRAEKVPRRAVQPAAARGTPAR